MSNKLYGFECKECGYNHIERGAPIKMGEYECPVCSEDCGHGQLLKLFPLVDEGLTND